MCKASFDRAILMAKQFIKYKIYDEAKKALFYARRYSGYLPDNMLIINELEKQIF